MWLKRLRVAKGAEMWLSYVPYTNHFYALVILSVRYLFSLEIDFTLYAMLYTPGYLWVTFHSDHAGLKPLPSLP